MKDVDEPAKKANQDDSYHESMIAIEVCGKDADLWERREPRLVERLANSFKKLLGADIRPDVTANNELLEAADTIANSAKEVLKVPQLKNLERQASVRLMLAKAKEKEANARKIVLEANKLEMEIEREQVLQSQAIIDRLITRGELIPIEKDGELVLVYKKRQL